VSRFLTSFPTTDYRAHSILNHAFDYGALRFEMGYAAAISFILFISMLFANWGIKKLLGKYLD
jgi:multiple sugar transport system permease protein